MCVTRIVASNCSPRTSPSEQLCGATQLVCRNNWARGAGSGQVKVTPSLSLFYANFVMPLIAVSSFELRVLAVSWQLLSLPTVPVNNIAAPSKTRHKEYTSGSFFAHRSGRAAAAGLQQAGAGRAMTDNERALL
jgi:hypothetical protein